jgi:hypothetical protein
MKPLLRSLALLGLGLSCTDRLPPGPAPLSMTPAQGTADEAVPVVITGNSFVARPHADFEDPHRSTLDDAFVATLGSTQLDNVELTASGTLTATVPAGMIQGVYDLTVVDPYGRTGELPQAYRVVTSAQDVASFHFDPVADQVEGVRFGIHITAVDAVGATVGGFVGSVQLADETGSLTPGSAGPFQLGEITAEVAVSKLSVEDTITATDALGHSGSSNTFSVASGPVVALVFTTPAVTTAIAGSCSPQVVLGTRDSNGLSSPASSALTIHLNAGAPDGGVAFFDGGFGFFSDAPCNTAVTSVTVPANAASAGFYFESQLAGQIAIVGTPITLPTTSQVETVDPAAPSRLSFTTPSVDIPVGVCSTALVVATTDAYGNLSPLRQGAAIDLTVIPASAAGFFTDPSCMSPSTSVSIGATQDQAQFYVEGTTVGTVTLAAAANSSSMLVPASQDETFTPLPDAG